MVLRKAIFILWIALVMSFVKGSKRSPNENNPSNPTRPDGIRRKSPASTTPTSPKVPTAKTSLTSSPPASPSKSKADAKAEERAARRALKEAKNREEGLRPVAIGPRPRYFSGTLLPLHWWEIYLRYDPQVKKEPKSIVVTPIFSSHYGTVSTPIGSFQIDLAQKINYWTIPNPLILPVGDYDMLFSFRDEDNGVIGEHVMPINVIALKIIGPTEPIALESGKPIELLLKNHSTMDMSCVRLVLAMYQPGKDLGRDRHHDALKDFAFRDISNLKPQEYRILTKEETLVLDPRNFGPFITDVYYVLAFAIAPHPDSVIDVEAEMERREEQRVMARGKRMLQKIKQHLDSNPGSVFYLSDSDSEADEERSAAAAAPTPSPRKTARQRWEEGMAHKRERLEYEAERSKEFVSFVLGYSQPIYIYKPHMLGQNRLLNIVPSVRETFSYPNSNSAVHPHMEFSAEIGRKGIRDNFGGCFSMELDGKCCLNGRHNLLTNQMVAAPPAEPILDGKVQLRVGFISGKTGNRTHVSGETNYVSSACIAPRYHSAVLLGKPFYFIFRVTQGLNHPWTAALYFENAYVELSVPNCIVSPDEYATEPHYRVLGKVPVSFGNRQLFPSTDDTNYFNAERFFGVSLTVSPKIIPDELVGTRTFMVRLYADISRSTKKKGLKCVRKEALIAESPIFALVHPKEKVPLLPDNLRLPATMTGVAHRPLYPLTSYVNMNEARKVYKMPHKRVASKSERLIPPTPLNYLKSKGKDELHGMAEMLTEEHLEEIKKAMKIMEELREMHGRVEEKKRRSVARAGPDSAEYKNAHKQELDLSRMIEQCEEYVEMKELKFKLDVEEYLRRHFGTQMQNNKLLLDIRNTRVWFPARIYTSVQDLNTMLACRDGLCGWTLKEQEVMHLVTHQAYPIVRAFDHRPRMKIDRDEEDGENVDPNEVNRAYQVYREAFKNKHGVELED